MALDRDTAIGRRAFRFARQGGDGEVYDRYADRYRLHCQCWGFERYAYCKHVSTIRAAGRFFHVAASKPGHRATGDLARNDPAAYAA